MATYNTPYKSGTFDGTPAASAATVTVAGFTPAAGDVGRLLYITSGSGKTQWREITAVSGQDVTLAHSFDSNAFLDPTSDGRATDVQPTSGDSCVVSYDMDDLISTDADIAQDDNNHLKITGTWALSGGAVIHCKSYHIELTSANVTIADQSAIIMGSYTYVDGQDAYTKDWCGLVDLQNSSSGDPWRPSSADFGSLEMYGGTILIPSGSPFWRLYENTSAPADVCVRLIGVVAKGSVGGRVDGNRSMIIIENEGGATTTGVFNPRAAVARVEISALSCDQAGYVFLTEGATGRLVFPRLVDIATRIIRCAGTSSGGTEVYEVIAKKSEVDNVAVFVNIGTSDGDHSFRYGNLVRPAFIGAAGLAISEEIKTRLYDTGPTFVTEQTVTDGQYPEEFVRHTDIPSTPSGNKTLADGTQYAPYTLRALSYGKQFSSTAINAEDTFESSIVLLDDLSITEPSKATVDAYTSIDSAAELYDAAVAWLQDNITDETAVLVTRTGDTVDLGSFDLTIDSGAAAAFAVSGSTITVKSSAFTGSITTTGTVTLTSATVTGIISDSTGTTGLLELT